MIFPFKFKLWCQREGDFLSNKLSPLWFESIVVVPCLEDLGIVLIEPSSVHLSIVGVESLRQTVTPYITVTLMFHFLSSRPICMAYSLSRI